MVTEVPADMVGKTYNVAVVIWGGKSPAYPTAMNWRYRTRAIFSARPEP